MKEIAYELENIICGNKSTSSPEQLEKALKEA